VIVTHKSIEAVEKHLLDKPDIILLNMEMADTKHIDAIKIIRKNEDPANRIPIIGLVSSLPDSNKTELKNYAPDDYVINTFGKEEFFKILEKHIGKKVSYLYSVNKTLETSTRVFNVAAFEEITNSDKAMMDTIMGYFVKDIPELIIKLRVAAVNKYFQEIEYFAHSLKGIAANMYAEKLKTTAYHIEIIGKSNNKAKMPECNALIVKLDKDFKEAKKEITDYLSKK
jgi:HPt (histidine-containing phosphotransfer) domain-containing protein